ncbi:MAG TPA: flagellar protein FlaG [Brevundimonas sp.]|uniref:flagellar protein FlaG n=1 Tax=Brevundimonas sp. TaxID=1871086 RepID=UPI00261F4346|nr:flagellar protein FlaG [Brevundimonas sp.]HRO31835.1 flagellar protein FlaG [Brevundimonas sp.]
MNANPKIAPVAVAAISSGTPSGEFDNRQSSVADEAERAARYRLVIEEGPQKGSFVYKTLDRVTGEVVRQLPREDVVRMMDEGRYSAGTVIDTTV